MRKYSIKCESHESEGLVLYFPCLIFVHTKADRLKPRKYTFIFVALPLFDIFVEGLMFWFALVQPFPRKPAGNKIV